MAAGKEEVVVAGLPESDDRAGAAEIPLRSSSTPGGSGSIGCGAPLGGAPVILPCAAWLLGRFGVVDCTAGVSGFTVAAFFRFFSFAGEETTGAGSVLGAPGIIEGSVAPGAGGAAASGSMVAGL